jgi:hypothetical protein
MKRIDEVDQAMLLLKNVGFYPLISQAKFIVQAGKCQTNPWEFSFMHNFDTKTIVQQLNSPRFAYIDLPAGSGKTMLTLLGSVLYAKNLLDQGDSRSKIILIFCPAPLHSQWERAICKVISAAKSVLQLTATLSCNPAEPLQGEGEGSGVQFVLLSQKNNKLSRDLLRLLSMDLSAPMALKPGSPYRPQVSISQARQYYTALGVVRRKPQNGFAVDMVTMHRTGRKRLSSEQDEELFLEDVKAKFVEFMANVALSKPSSSTRCTRTSRAPWGMETTRWTGPCSIAYSGESSDSLPASETVVSRSFKKDTLGTEETNQQKTAFILIFGPLWMLKILLGKQKK